MREWIVWPHAYKTPIVSKDNDVRFGKPLPLPLSDLVLLIDYLMATSFNLRKGHILLILYVTMTYISYRLAQSLLCFLCRNVQTLQIHASFRKAMFHRTEFEGWGFQSSGCTNIISYLGMHVFLSDLHRCWCFTLDKEYQIKYQLSNSFFISDFHLYVCGTTMVCFCCCWKYNFTFRQKSSLAYNLQVI